MARRLLERSAMESKRPRVLIVGGGFAGLSAARALGRAPVDVLVIDRENHHLFQPLVYQVAMAALSATDVSAPIRSILARHENTQVVLAEVTGIDIEARQAQAQVCLQGSMTLPYDYVVIASGAEPNYFGHDEWEPLAPSPKSLDAALEIRKRVLLAFEEAECEDDPRRRRQLLEFVVIGGGPTGVEFAGALAELSQSTLARDFRKIDPRQTRIHLVEGGPRLLPAYPADLSLAAAKQLEALGVLMHLGARVVGLNTDGATLANGKCIEAATVIWGAGVKPTNLARLLPVAHDPVGRVIVGPDLSIPGHPEVFVVGDLAHFEQDGTALPGLAPVAMQQGRAVAESIEQSVAGRPRKAFRYRDKGMLATIGRSRAVGVIGGLRFKGFAAWIVWALVHIFYLVGFRNRVVVLLEWMWNYVTYKRGARVIAGLHASGSLAPHPAGAQVVTARCEPAETTPAESLDRADRTQREPSSAIPHVRST
jgi:NADH dehydrogenase